MFEIKEEKIKRYVVFSIAGFVMSVVLYTWNNLLITQSPIDLQRLLAMAITFDPKIALDFFEYLAANGFQRNETLTLIINILFLCSYGLLYWNFYRVIALNKVIARPLAVIAPWAQKIGLLLALVDLIKTVILIYMVYFYKSMPTGVILLHSTTTYIVMPLYTLMLLWFFINCLFLGIGYLMKRTKTV